jgi:imidazolonepropionase-like amidohydrolase
MEWRKIGSQIRRQSEGRMDDVTARLEALLRRYLTEASRCRGVPSALDGLAEKYRRDIGQLVSEYGQPAVNAAMNEMPDVPWPSVSLH